MTPLQRGAIPTVRGTPAYWVSPRREQKSACLILQLEGIKTAFAPTRRPDSNHFDQSADSSICNSLRHSQMQTDANKNLLISINGLKWREMKFSFSWAWLSSVICSSARSWLFFSKVGCLVWDQRGVERDSRLLMCTLDGIAVYVIPKEPRNQTAAALWTKETGA